MNPEISEKFSEKLIIFFGKFEISWNFLVKILFFRISKKIANFFLGKYLENLKAFFLFLKNFLNLEI